MKKYVSSAPQEVKKWIWPDSFFVYAPFRGFFAYEIGYFGLGGAQGNNFLIYAPLKKVICNIVLT